MALTLLIFTVLDRNYFNKLYSQQQQAIKNEFDLREFFANQKFISAFFLSMHFFVTWNGRAKIWAKCIWN